jgi:two-component system, NtrC family, sensor kinase
LFAQHPAAMVIAGFDGVLREANDAMVQLLGWPASEIVGRDSYEFTDLSLEECKVRYAQVARDGRGMFRSRIKRADGSTFLADEEMSVLELDDERVALILLRDLSDQEKLQQELVQAQKMEAIGLLVAGVAHELNNPLAAIVGFSQLIRSDPRLPDDMSGMADTLIAEADRTRRIVNNLLDFARQRPPERHATPLRPLIQSVIDLQAYSYIAGRIEVTVELEDGLPVVELDRQQLQQVLLNLTLNAVQAIRSVHDRGTLRIRATQVGAGGRVRIAIEDDGPGVPESDRPRLFVPFFSTKAPGEGTGLGLAVSAGIVAGHGGRLWHEPIGSGGSRFIIELPIVAAADTRPEVAHVAFTPPAFGPLDEAEGTAPAVRAPAMGPDAAPPLPAAVSSSGGRPRLLILDDEPSIRAFLAKALARSGYETVTVGSGAEALELARTESFDGMLCDHRMAGMSGTAVFEAMSTIRPELANRFVFMSGDVLNPELRSFAAEHGIGLLAKPFDLDSIARVVHELLTRA